MVFDALVRRAQELSSRSLRSLPDRATWESGVPERRRQWLDMLGLDPLPELADLKVTVTGVIERDDHVVEKLHYEYLPNCRMAANLYRPKEVPGRLPGVVYVCGHSKAGKAWYQPHARWFGRHGYVCLIVDTIEIGECLGDHHGVYHRGWWHWYSQGYSPVATEVWAAMRGADLLQARDDVDPNKLGITGISGGGVVSWFTGAADERFTVVAPVCQTGTAEQQTRDRTIDGHCDCTTWVNHLGWDWADVGALIAPRPLFVGSATEDCLWRPWSNREILLRLRRLYRLLEVEERVALVEDLVPHSYTPVIRLPLFSWFDRWLKGSDVPVNDDVDEDNLSDEALHAFPGGKPPAGDQTEVVHDLLIPLPEPPAITSRPALESYRDEALRKLRELTFRGIPAVRETPSYEARPRGNDGSGRSHSCFRFATEPGLEIQAWLAMPLAPPPGTPLLVGALQADARTPILGMGTGIRALPAGVARGSVEVRGTGGTSVGPGLEWTLRRCYPLLGQTLPERRTLDLLRGIDVLRDQPNVGPAAVFGRGEAAALAIYAAILDPTIAEAVLDEPVETHWNGGPEFCHVLRVGDLAQNLALVFPRPITFVGALPEAYEWTKAAYEAAGLGQQVRVVSALSDWQPAA